mgnify:FL=1
MESVVPIFIAIAGGLLVEVFFQLVKYDDSLNSSSPILNTSASNYLSVRQLASCGHRKWLNYFLFRTLPVAIISLLVVSIEQRYCKVNEPCVYAIISTIISLVFRDFLELFKKKKFIGEKLVHIVNIFFAICVGTLVGIISNNADVSIIAPSSINSLLDNLWSSMIVAMLVLLYFRMTNMGGDYNATEDENNIIFTNYVVRTFGDIYNNYHEYIDSYCKNEVCNKLLLYSILVYEDMNRPRVIRRIENTIVALFGCELTVGVAQVKSKKPLTDIESIKIAIEILKNTDGCNAYDVEEVKNAVRVYNSGEAYAEAVIEVVPIVCKCLDLEAKEKSTGCPRY